MKDIFLNNLQLKRFTERDIKDYCILNNLDINTVKYINLGDNELIDISEIKLFKNTEYLYLYNNKIKDISVIQYLKILIYLDISGLELESDQIEYINDSKIINLLCSKGFKNKTDIYKIKRTINLYFE